MDFEYILENEIGIFSPMRKEYSIATGIPLEDIYTSKLLDWVLLNKHNIPQSKIDEFWSKMVDEIKKERLESAIHSAKNLKL